MVSRGNDYWVADLGVRDAALIHSYYEDEGDVIIARTDEDVVIAYSDRCSKRDVEEVKEWADEFGYEIEWE
jgi:N-dimethylarginine dimethylaminohydrolase